MLATRWLLAAALPLLGACRPDSFQELPPRLKPLLETLPAATGLPLPAYGAGEHYPRGWFARNVSAHLSY
jgi:hypothetical protein